MQLMTMWASVARFDKRWNCSIQLSTLWASVVRSLNIWINQTLNCCLPRQVYKAFKMFYLNLWILYYPVLFIEHSDEDVLEDLSGDEGQSVDETGPSWANRLPPSLVANAQTVGASVGSPTKSITPKGSPRKGAPSPGRSAEVSLMVV